jgi:hypothetical protein
MGCRGRDRMVVRFTTTYATITHICSNCALILYVVTWAVGATATIYQISAQLLHRWVMIA